ncbi:MAG TPA: cytochrome b N-terminal domain-containing protein, partial [Gaiellaceae bacterium]|nr:cytochrome b N-terminal domain-containing protein [Gaiellaceae bacterium]
GPWLAQFLRSGQEIGGETLTRFYSLHMLVIPAAIIALITLHLYLVIRLGVTSPPWSKDAAGMEPVEEEPVPARRPGLVRPVPRGAGANAMQAEPGGRE